MDQSSAYNLSRPLLLHLHFLLLGVAILLVGSRAQLLPQDEVQALNIISEKLKNTYWKEVSVASCSDRGRTFNKTFAYMIFSNVTCNCSFNGATVCHVTSILLKGLNLSGVFPAEFGNLIHLQVIDLSRNYLNGSIPTSLSRIPLVNISLEVNRISGPIPEEFGQILTLQEVNFEDNQFSGQLPESLGNLDSLRRLHLSSNFFTGTIPETYGNLKYLQDFTVDGSNFSGPIPDFIGNWSEISILNIEGAFTEGPIPATLSLLTNLTELRISDLNLSSTPFPNLQAMTNLEVLILRNCLISGTIPNYIGDTSNLKTLDLSFNQLTGQIPDSIGNLGKLVNLFLSNNLLSGIVPGWLSSNTHYKDVSYNNFTGSPSTSCQNTNVNLVSSFSSIQGNSNNWCLKKDLACAGRANHHSLFVNCGGGKMSYDGNEYLEDTSPGEPSSFSSTGNQWAFSSTGTFLYNDNAPFIASNTFNLNMTGPKYFLTARVSPSSLKYYGLCLREGSYTVKLHFAEIMYSNDQTYSSLGNRIFDIYIQGTLKQKNFNIMTEAGGVGIGITKTYPDIIVNSSTLEIFLYWAGKGTTAVPLRGVYGPLISAITVTPNFSVKTGLSIGVIVAIVIVSCVILASILALLKMKGYLGGKGYGDHNEFQGLDTGYFSLRQIKAATNDFSPLNKIGEGGFGPVYKGVLPDGKVIAVKQLSAKSKQGNREFINEIGMISALQHPNLVKLYGCCIEGKELLLVYEYMVNNSLARALFGREDARLNFDWTTRKKICLGIARGLAYLHEESRLKIVHRDIKATNVLLDKDLNVKISDFGLAKLDEDENSHISTRIAGTIGYMAPEYAMRGYLTSKADIYSYGVVVLEVVSGKSNTNYRPKEEFVYLLDWAYVLHEQGNLLELVDPSLGSDYSEEEAMILLNLALLCTNPSPTLRPKMSSVVSMILGEIPVQAPKVTQGATREGLRFKAFEMPSQDQVSEISMSSIPSEAGRSISIDGPWINSSTPTVSKDEQQEKSLLY
ncbi:hypothetical protein Dimus_018807 [Dionaea muscipula]